MARYGTIAVVLAVVATTAAAAPLRPASAKARAPKAQTVKPAPTKSAGKAAPAKAVPAKPAAIKVVAASEVPPVPVPGSLAYPGGVTALRDLVYAALPGFRPLTLDLYRPSPAPKPYPRPLVIFVHGGMWRGGDARHGAGMEDFPLFLASLAARNYIVASIDYRLSGEAHFPAPLQDVKSAIRWLRAHADTYGIDTTRIAIWGEEAGGHLAAMAATTCGVAVMEPPPAKDGDAKDKAAKDEISDCVEAAIIWDGISDLALLDREGDATPQGAYLGCEPASCEPGFVHAASATGYVGPNSPPFLIADSGKLPAQTGALYAALSEAHVPLDRAAAGPGNDAGQSALAGIVGFLIKVFPPPPPPTPAPPPKNTALPY